MTEEEYNKLYRGMLKSVYINGGFYIGRYEMGISVVNNSSYNNVTSSIMFGMQWDAVCVFIEHFDKKNTATTKSDWVKKNEYSKLWGNYKNSEFKLDRGFYTIRYTSSPVTWVEDYTTKKTTTATWMCTSGTSEQNKSLNIYDFGGNQAEWTLERSNNPLTSDSSYYISSRVSLYVK